MHVYRAGKVRKLKEGVSLQEYLDKYPDAYRVRKPPSLGTLERWSCDGIGEALDGCRVEPDGHCEHGKPSWFLALNLI